MLARDEKHETEATEHEDEAGHAPAISEEDRAVSLVMILDPHDAPRFADLLRRYPTLRERLIAEATQWLGSDFVGEALALLSGAVAADHEGPIETADGDAPADVKDAEAEHETDEGEAQEATEQLASDLKLTGIDEDGTIAYEICDAPVDQREEILTEAATEPATAAELVDELEEPEAEAEAEHQEAAEDGPTVAEVEQTETEEEEQAAHEPVSEPGWVTRAHAYHARHADWVAEFNELTGHVCAGKDGGVDPVLVSRWQVAHGVDPDGRVGPMTLAAARAAGKTEPAPVTAPDEAKRTILVGDLEVELE